MGDERARRPSPAPRSSSTGRAAGSRARRGRRSTSTCRPAASTGSRRCSAGPPCLTAVPYCCSRVCRLWRVSACSEVSTWSSWTGSIALLDRERVAVGGDRRRSGVPGLTSTKKLPSRKCAGGSRTSRPCGAAAPACRSSSSRRRRCIAAGVCAASWQPGPAPMLCTLPTLTPAIRTSDAGRSPFALENVAWTVNWLANGLANFVNTRYVNTTITTIPITPAANVLRPLRRRRASHGLGSGAEARSSGCG